MKINKKNMLLLSLVITLLVGAGGVIAYIFTHTQNIKNAFTPTQVSCVVDEKFENNKKTEVSVENTSNIDAFIRAEIVVTWKMKNPDGSEDYFVHAKAPVLGEDYVLEFNRADKTLEEKGWFYEDGFYYYKEACEPGENTSVLIESCKLADTATPPGDDYFLSVEIIASAIQADGGSNVTVDGQQVWKPAVEQAWKVVTVGKNSDNEPILIPVQ